MSGNNYESASNQVNVTVFFNKFKNINNKDGKEYTTSISTNHPEIVKAAKGSAKEHKDLALALINAIMSSSTDEDVNVTFSDSMKTNDSTNVDVSGF